MKILRYLFLILCAAAELFFLVFGIIGISLYWGTNNPNVPIAMVLSEAVLSLVMLGLTITSAFMVKKEKRFPVLWPFLMKIPAVILWLGISWFALDIPQAGWVGVRAVHCAAETERRRRARAQTTEGCEAAGISLG